MVDAGLKISINSDDPALFPTTLRREMDIAGELMPTIDEAWFIENSIAAAFLDDEEGRPEGQGVRGHRPVAQGLPPAFSVEALVLSRRYGGEVPALLLDPVERPRRREVTGSGP
jgi:hypothetical protein